MCGICGKVLNRDGDNQSLASVVAMTETLVHRGPDDSRVHCAHRAALGHRRLSIIDLSTGRQPMFNEDGDVAVVFNGEIYNFPILRDELICAGHRFVSSSDTEVIVHLYEEMGPDFVHRLRGMFAIAVWDERGQQLTLARDRLGKKPLFYMPMRDGLIFASELKALLQDEALGRAVDPVGMKLYLELGYIPAPHTILDKVRKLKPGHVLTWRDNVLKVWCYWNAPPVPAIDGKSETDLLSELDTRLREAVRVRLMSDVPLGAFLSGGIDSSLVVALMADMLDEPVRTFSIGFEQETHNELPYARQVAERYATRHTEFTVRPDATEVLPKLVWHLDEPFADASALPTYYVSSLAREHVTVALNGDGGDELFAGYGRFRSENLIHIVGRLPRAIRQLLSGLLERVPQGRSTSPQARLRRICARSLLDFTERIADYYYSNGFHPEQLEDLCTPGFLDQIRGILHEKYVVKYLASLPDMDQTNSALAVGLGIYLPDDLLVKMDRMSMACSLEARSPMLDQEFVAWAVRLPWSYKVRGVTTKYLLRKLAERYLPNGLAYRKKQGFSVPVNDWFRRELREMAYDILLSQRSRNRGYFRVDRVQELLDAHQIERNHGQQIWTLLMLELWHQQFIDTNVRFQAHTVPLKMTVS
jgi:asparagine synthase (glutamine-hydrolysing)